MRLGYKKKNTKRFRIISISHRRRSWLTANFLVMTVTCRKQVVNIADVFETICIQFEYFIFALQFDEKHLLVLFVAASLRWMLGTSASCKMSGYSYSLCPLLSLSDQSNTLFLHFVNYIIINHDGKKVMISPKTALTQRLGTECRWSQVGLSQISALSSSPLSLRSVQIQPVHFRLALTFFV